MADVRSAITTPVGDAPWHTELGLISPATLDVRGHGADSPVATFDGVPGVVRSPGTDPTAPGMAEDVLRHGAWRLPGEPLP